MNSSGCATLALEPPECSASLIFIYLIKYNFWEKRTRLFPFHVSTICLCLRPFLTAFTSHLSIPHAVPSPLTSTSLSAPSKPNTILMANSNTKFTFWHLLTISPILSIFCRQIFEVIFLKENLCCTWELRFVFSLAFLLLVR